MFYVLMDDQIFNVDSYIYVNLKIIMKMKKFFLYLFKFILIILIDCFITILFIYSIILAFIMTIFRVIDF